MILGPMAGVTDLPFRLLCREQGADLVTTEMISAKAMFYGNKGTDELLRTCAAEGPVSVQLFGSDPEICAEMAMRLDEGNWFAIDFNMGCPVPKVVNNGEGSALMRNPELAERIVAAIVRRVKKPVTVKIRSGFDDAHLNAPELARRLEAAGAAAITVHARTRTQMYHGAADWEMIRRVRDAVSVPLIGNGDVTSRAEAQRMKAETGCDAVMIARAALGNPWVFRRNTGQNAQDRQGDVLRADGNGSGPEFPDKTGSGMPEVSMEELRAMMLRHLQMSVDFYGEERAIREMRKHLAWYTHGRKGSSRFRDEINHTETLAALIDKISTCGIIGEV